MGGLSSLRVIEARGYHNKGFMRRGSGEEG
jgi:hypothetical protein